LFVFAFSFSDEVLTDMEDTQKLVDELRQKIMKEALGEGNETLTLTEEQKTDFIDRTLKIIDQDGNGEVDKDEFRNLLRYLKLTYRYV
jgi:Ca2+-binding EF-hand superfamily protein